LRLSSPVFSSEAVGLDVSGIELPDSLIIELDPHVLIFFDVGEIMSEVSSSIMKDDSLEFILELIFGGDVVLEFIERVIP
jgi:hypothetical protein